MKKNSQTPSELLKMIYMNSHFRSDISSNLFPTSVSEKQGHFLADLVQKFQPRVLLELGFGFGISSLWLESGEYKPADHTIVDPYRNEVQSDVVFGYIKEFKNVHFVEKESQIYLAELHESQRKIDMVFLDADERFDAMMVDLYFVTKLLRKRGVVIIRNVWSPSVRSAVRFYLRNLPYKILSLRSAEEKLVRILPGFLADLYLKYRFKSQDFFVLQLENTDQRKWNHFKRF